MDVSGKVTIRRFIANDENESLLMDIISEYMDEDMKVCSDEELHRIKTTDTKMKDLPHCE